MSSKGKVVIDLDGTLVPEGADLTVHSADREMLDRIWKFKDLGWDIALFSSRNMSRFRGNQGLLSLHTAPEISAWLTNEGIPCDELFLAKPWCGHQGFYVDDRAVRPREFLSLEAREIRELMAQDRVIDP